MKRLILLSLVLLMASLAVAQTQRGLVKTKGRMVNGQLVPGQGLPGATVNIQGGSSVGVRNDDGSFSFVVPTKTFMVQSVQKKGYELVDPEVTTRLYQQSENILYLVMETPEKQMMDQLEAAEKINRTLYEQLNRAHREISRLRDENKITEKEYRQRIDKLMEDQKSNKSLIEEMARQYARMDYDQMDSLNQRISDAILNGRLTEADSLLRSKGDMRSRIDEIRKEQQVEEQEETEIAHRQQNLDESKAGTQKKLEDVASDCYKFFDRFKLENLHDSAAYYIEFRAELDTTNAEWQWDAAYYFKEQNQLMKSKLYYEKALVLYRKLAESNPQAYELDLALTLINLANVSYNSEIPLLHLEALKIIHHLAESDSIFYIPYEALVLNNIAVYFKNTNNYDASESYYNKSLELYCLMAKYDPHTYEPEVANVLLNLANLYQNRSFQISEELYNKALSIFRRFAESDLQTYEIYVANTLNNMASLYIKEKCYSESEAMLIEAFEIYNRLAQSNPQAYEPDKANILYTLAILYYETERFPESEAMFKEIIEIYNRLAQSNPQAYEPDKANILFTLANLYYETEHYPESEALYKEALDMYLHLAEFEPKVYESYVAKVQYEIGYLFFYINKYEEAISAFEEALEISRKMTLKDRSQFKLYDNSLYYLSILYATNNNFIKGYNVCEELMTSMRFLYVLYPNTNKSDYLALLFRHSINCLYNKRFIQAEQYAREGLSVDDKYYNLYTYLAASLLFQGKYKKARRIYSRYKYKLKEIFLNEFKKFKEESVIPEQHEKEVKSIIQMLEK